MEYEVNSRPFGEHDMVDDVIEAANALAAAVRFARESGIAYPATVYVRAVGPCKIVSEVTLTDTFAASVELPDDERHVEAVAFRLHQAAFFAQRPERASHVLAKSWMTAAFDHGGRIDDFETRVRAVQLLIHFDLFVADEIARRDHARN